MISLPSYNAKELDTIIEHVKVDNKYNKQSYIINYILMQKKISKQTKINIRIPNYYSTCQAEG
jgi:hypothetical protein